MRLKSCGPCEEPRVVDAGPRGRHPASVSVTAATPWPTLGQNAQHSGASPSTGAQTSNLVWTVLPSTSAEGIAVASDGRVGLTYYDFRTLTPDNTTTLPTYIWFKSAPRGGNLAKAAETHVTGTFNFLAAPNAGVTPRMVSAGVPSTATSAMPGQLR